MELSAPRQQCRGALYFCDIMPLIFDTPWRTCVAAIVFMVRNVRAQSSATSAPSAVRLPLGFFAFSEA